eukprot:gene19463-26124_t
MPGDDEDSGVVKLIQAECIIAALKREMEGLREQLTGDQESDRVPELEREIYRLKQQLKKVAAIPVEPVQSSSPTTPSSGGGVDIQVIQLQCIVEAKDREIKNLRELLSDPRAVSSSDEHSLQQQVAELQKQLTSSEDRVAKLQAKSGRGDLEQRVLELEKELAESHNKIAELQIVSHVDLAGRLSPPKHQVHVCCLCAELVAETLPQCQQLVSETEVLLQRLKLGEAPQPQQDSTTAVGGGLRLSQSGEASQPQHQPAAAAPSAAAGSRSSLPESKALLTHSQSMSNPTALVVRYGLYYSATNLGSSQSMSNPTAPGASYGMSSTSFGSSPSISTSGSNPNLAASPHQSHSWSRASKSPLFVPPGVVGTIGMKFSPIKDISSANDRLMHICANPFVHKCPEELRWEDMRTLAASNTPQAQGSGGAGAMNSTPIKDAITENDHFMSISSNSFDQKSPEALQWDMRSFGSAGAPQVCQSLPMMPLEISSLPVSVDHVQSEVLPKLAEVSKLLTKLKAGSSQKEAGVYSNGVAARVHDAGSSWHAVAARDYDAHAPFADKFAVAAVSEMEVSAQGVAPLPPALASPDFVELNVSGTILSTTREALQLYSSSRLSEACGLLSSESRDGQHSRQNQSAVDPSLPEAIPFKVPMSAWSRSPEQSQPPRIHTAAPQVTRDSQGRSFVMFEPLVFGLLLEHLHERATFREVVVSVDDASHQRESSAPAPDPSSTVATP